MPWDERTTALIAAFQSGRLSRRQFVRRLVSAGLSGSAIAAVLAACGGESGSTPALSGNQSSPATGSGGSTAAPATPIPTVVVAAPSADAGIMKAPEPNPKRGGTLRMAFGVTTASYDIHQGGSASALCHMYNNLIRLNLVDGLRTIVPDVAERWEMAPDGLAYTFKLRGGVQFHDGSPLTADDVVATYNRIIFPPQGVASTLKDRYAAVAKVEAVDPLTVKFTMKEPSADFLLVLTDTTNAIYSKKTLDANNNDLRKVIAPGTGPFLYKEYKDSEKWTFVRNPNYWNKELPYLDSLELIHVPAWSDRGTAVLTGQADVSWNVSGETWEEGTKRKDIVNTHRVKTFGGYHVIINTKKKPFDDPRVRRAIHLAINRQTLIETYRSQEQIVLTRWVPHGGEFATPQDEIAKLPGYRPDKTADIAEAKKLLADAGYPDGVKDVELLSASVPPHAEIMSPAIQDQLKRALNMEIRIRLIERSILVEEQKAGRFTLVLDTPGGPISDFSPIGNTYFKSGGSQNFGGYSNPKFDELLKKSDQELDRAKRADLLNQLQDLLDQDPPWMFIGYEDHLPMWRVSAKGLALEKRVQLEWGRVDTAWLDK